MDAIGCRKQRDPEQGVAYAPVPMDVVAGSVGDGCDRR